MTAVVLALDTSTEACSVALQFAQGTIVRQELTPRTHTQRLLPLIESLLAEAGLARSDISTIVYGRGPGSFTGVRIGAAAAQGLAYGLGVPVIGISSLQAMAQGAADALSTDRVMAAIDARMGEVYWGCYQRDQITGLLQATSAEQVIAPERISDSLADALAAGSGWASYAEALAATLAHKPARIEPAYYPDATALLRLATQQSAAAAATAIPVYLRDNVAKKSAQQIRRVGHEQPDTPHNN